MAHRRPIASLTSAANLIDDARLSAPSALRNLPLMIELLEEFAPKSGRALEIASGTGEQIVGFAQAFDQIIWHPSEIDPQRLKSIDAWCAAKAVSNVAKALPLDALEKGWGKGQGPFDLVVLSNLLHLITTDEVKVLISEIGQILRSGGRFVLYGPFMRAGELTSQGDMAFHAALQKHDPMTGYKDDFDTIEWCSAAGMDPIAAIEMPANNLALIFEKF